MFHSITICRNFHFSQPHNIKLQIYLIDRLNDFEERALLKNVLLYSSLVVVNIMWLTGTFAYAFFYEICSVILKEKLKKIMSKMHISAEDIKDLYEDASQVNAALDYTCPYLFFVLQVSIIITVYMVIADFKNINGLFFAIGNLFYTYFFITGLGECYDLASKVLHRAQTECVRKGKII